MADYLNKNYTKLELLRKTGSLKSIAGITSSAIILGKADGIKTLNVKNGELEFDLMQNRALDILTIKYKGIPLNFLSKTGPVDAKMADPAGMNFLRSITGGMMYTCGLTNVGAQFEDETGIDYFHGRLRFLPAENLAITEKWDNDDYLLEVSGEMKDGGVYRENLSFGRNVKTIFGTKTISIDDTIENLGFKENPFMIMYHINCGFPILDKDTLVFIPSDEVLPMNENAKENIGVWDQITEPLDDGIENVFVHKLKADENGKVLTGVYNEKLKLGYYMEFDVNDLPFVIEWKSMVSGDYALGIQPANCFGQGRGYEIKNNSLQKISPFETKKISVKLTVLDGENDLLNFIKRYNNCKRGSK